MGYAPLHEASRHGDLAIVKEIIANCSGQEHKQEILDKQTTVSIIIDTINNISCCSALEPICFLSFVLMVFPLSVCMRVAGKSFPSNCSLLWPPRHCKVSYCRGRHDGDSR